MSLRGNLFTEAQSGIAPIKLIGLGSTRRSESDCSQLLKNGPYFGDVLDTDTDAFQFDPEIVIVDAKERIGDKMALIRNMHQL